MPRSVRLNINSPGNSGQHEVALQTTSIKCLVTDYDGTISPIHVPRFASHVPIETRRVLRQISRSIPVSIITTKDLHFIRPRTPFAGAWSAIGGLEIQIGKRLFESESLESKLPAVSQALNYAGSHLTASGIEIEEKQESDGRTVAFCIDWRRAKNLEEARKEADRVMDYSKRLGLRVFKYEEQPFCDVYPIAPDKGTALRNILSELGVKEGVMYLGDSEMDNSAFRGSDISVGVVHCETRLETLECDYLVKFEDVPKFLRTLISHAFLFSSDFSMIKSNSVCPIRPAWKGC
jgi:trehalose-phosphatase